MTPSKSRRRFYLAAAMAAFAFTGSWAAGQARSMRDRSEVAKMTEKMRTVCAGRHLVDVPLQAEVRMSHGRIDGFAIETQEESEEQFRARVSAREAEIDTAGAGVGPNGPGGIVEARDLRIPGMIGRTLVFGRTRSHGFEQGRRVNDEWGSAESHAHMKGFSVSLSAKYVDEQDARAAEALLARMRLRAGGEIPAEPGFCTSHAMFAEPLPAHKTEHIAMHIGFPGHPDVAMSPVALLRITKLREGKRIINSLDGEEVLVRAREFNFTTTYGFSWETGGVDDDPLQPYLALELQTGASERAGGKPSDTSLHEDALLALWDGIAATIRPSNPAASPALAARAAHPGGSARQPAAH